MQSKIKIEEYARGSSRASSVISTRSNAINPSVNANNRIHPVQRFSSVGANHDFILNRPAAPSPQPSTVYSCFNGINPGAIYNGSASPSYQTPRNQLPQRPLLNSDALYRHRRYPLNSSLNRPNGNLMQRMERPRSVVSGFF